MPLLPKGLGEMSFLTSSFRVGEGEEGEAERGGEGEERPPKGADGHDLADFNIGCKIANAYNKQKYIFSLKKKFNVQREVECSFLISVAGESVLGCIFFCAFQEANRVTQDRPFKSLCLSVRFKLSYTWEVRLQS